MGVLANYLMQGARWLFTTVNANGVLVLIGSWFSGSSDDKTKYSYGLTALISVLITYLVLKKMR